MRLLAALFGSAALAACSQVPAISPESERPTIVSLNPCSDAVLVEVADPEQILALSSYSSDPASSSMDVAVARRFRAVAGSVEEVIALRPDVVIAGSFLPPATTAALEKAGLVLVRMPIAMNVAESKEQLRRIARLAGRPEQGEALVARIESALVSAAPSRGTPPVSAVVWQSGGIVPGDGTLIADLLRRTGFSNFSASRGMVQADYLPLENILANPPQVIFVAGDLQSEEDRLLRHPALAQLDGTDKARFDASLLWCGGPTIIRAAQRLAEVRRAVAESRR